MQLPYSDMLDIARFSRLFDNKSESYKLFWFQAIVHKIYQGERNISFEALIDEMIADAWYMVLEYRLNLGPSDTLEKAVHYLGNISKLKTSEKKDVILRYLHTCQDKEVRKYKQTLSLNVPYRLQAPFMDSMKGSAWSKSSEKLALRINKEQGLLYSFSAFQGLNTKIRIREEWAHYIIQNYEIINGWVEYNMVQYLQRRNPSVPGIIDKLNPPKARNLNKVIKYWKMLAEIRPIREIYGGELLSPNNISIDHFVPWSYVAHDEFWNLTPTLRRINSSKSNSLPDWDTYFPVLCENEYLSYTMMWERPGIKAVFDKLAVEHLNNEEIRHKLYQKGLSEAEFSKRLNDVLFPIYQNAENMGFLPWKL